MQGNLLATLLALVFYLTSGLFGGGSGSVSPTIPTNSGVPSAAYPKAGTVISQQVNLRSQPSTTGTIIATLNKGTGVVINAATNDWYQVQNGGTQGWLARWAVSVRSVAPNYSRKIIAGYYVENYLNDPVSYQSLSRNLGAINMVIPFSFSLDQYGTISSTHNPKPVKLALSAGADTLALVNNIRSGNFNSNSIHRMLSSSVARSRAVNAIKRVVVENGFQGVNIDFENVPSRDQSYITAFFKELAAAMHANNLIVTASLPAKTYNDNSSSHGGAFNYREIAPYLDMAMIMTYDEHYTGGPAGPVASYPWVEKVINYTRQYFAPDQIVVGLAAYGYDWGWGDGKALNNSAIQSLIRSKGITPKWSSQYKVPYFTYRSWGISHQVWYESKDSIAAKMNLIRKYNLRGVAVWRLGYEDSSIWKVIQQGFY